jgi:hypothetical protein
MFQTKLLAPFQLSVFTISQSFDMVSPILSRENIVITSTYQNAVPPSSIDLVVASTALEYIIICISQYFIVSFIAFDYIVTSMPR